METTYFSESFMMTPDGKKVRYLYAKPSDEIRNGKTVVILQGRASFIEKYFEVISDLNRFGFDVWAFDWRGQGGSSRLISHPQKIFIDSYNTYLADLHQLMEEKILPGSNGSPVIFFASSMGAAVGMLFLQTYPNRVSHAAFIAPMFNLISSPLLNRGNKKTVNKVANQILSATSLLLCRCGFGQRYVCGYGDFDVNRANFQSNSSTQDPIRFETQVQLARKYPQWVTGGPTYQWLNATLQVLDEILDPQRLAQVRTPLLILSAGKDRVVGPIAPLELERHIPSARILRYENARHSIHTEVKEIREIMWKDFLEFVG